MSTACTWDQSSDLHCTSCRGWRFLWVRMLTHSFAKILLCLDVVREAQGWGVEGKQACFRVEVQPWFMGCMQSSTPPKWRRGQVIIYVWKRKENHCITLLRVLGKVHIQVLLVWICSPVQKLQSSFMLSAKSKADSILASSALVTCYFQF